MLYFLNCALTINKFQSKEHSLLMAANIFLIHEVWLKQKYFKYYLAVIKCCFCMWKLVMILK